MCIQFAAMLPMLGTAASIGGTAMSVMGQINASRAEAASNNFQAAQSKILAEDALKRGAADEQAQRRKTAALASRQEAVMAASNLDIGSGSPLSILGDTAMMGELDAQVVRGNAAREAQQHNTQGKMFTMSAKNAKSAGMVQAFGTALGGVGTLAEKWYQPARRTMGGNSSLLGRI